MENSNSTSRKIFSGVYALLALFSALLMLQLLLTNQAFVDFRGSLLFVVAAFTFLITAIAVWVKWNDTFEYKYEAPYKISPLTKVVKPIYGSFAITVAICIVFIVLGLYLFDFKSFDSFIFKYGVFIVFGCTALFYPFVKRFMK